MLLKIFLLFFGPFYLTLAAVNLACPSGYLMRGQSIFHGHDISMAECEVPTLSCAICVADSAFTDEVEVCGINVDTLAFFNKSDDTITMSLKRTHFICHEDSYGRDKQQDAQRYLIAKKKKFCERTLCGMSIPDDYLELGLVNATKQSKLKKCRPTWGRYKPKFDQFRKFLICTESKYVNYFFVLRLYQNLSFACITCGDNIAICRRIKRDKSITNITHSSIDFTNIPVNKHNLAYLDTCPNFDFLLG